MQHVRPLLCAIHVYQQATEFLACPAYIAGIQTELLWYI